jgi:translation elongation factor EF-1alpha
MKEKIIGVVSHYYNNIGVATITLEGQLAVGDTIRIKGHITDFTQKIESIQIEHKNVTRAKEGDDIGIKVKEYSRKYDMVYKVIEE